MPTPIPGAAPRRLEPVGPLPNAAPDSGASVRRLPGMPAQMPAKAGISVEGVGRIDSESIGVYTRNDGGVGIDMWQGAARADVVDLINAIPRAPGYATLRDVAARLLLSRAEAPPAGGDNPPSLLAARARALMELGDVDSAELLISVASKQNRPEGLDAADATLQLIRYDNARACGLARNNQTRASSDFWSRILVYCDALDGKAESTNLGLSMLREVGDDDRAMALLADSLLTGNAVTLGKIETPKPIHFAMTRAAKADLPASIAEADSPLVLHAAALAPNLSLKARLEAAERAVAVGALNPVDLRQLYQKMAYSDEDRANALSRSGEMGGPSARALLYQAASSQNIPSARAEIIQQALTIGREDGRYRAAVLAFRPLIDRLPPSPEMVWFALSGVRAFLTVGEPVGVDRWLALLRASAEVLDENRAALARVSPLGYLLGAGDERENLGDVLSAWRQSLGDTPDAVARQELLNGLFLALGHDVPPSAWAGVPFKGLYPQKMPTASVWFRFRDAISRIPAAGSGAMPLSATAGLGQVTVIGDENPGTMKTPPGAAPAIVLALQAMGNGGPGAQGTAVLFEVVSALKRLGLEGAARRLAVEAALAAGL